MTRVVVVGGGVAGLAAAFELSEQPDVSVTVLDAGALGGKLRGASLGGRCVDVGPDGFLARRPEARELLEEIGASELLAPVGAQGAWVLARGRLRALPAGLSFGVPTRLRDLRTRDAVGILGVRGAMRAALDVIAPQPARRSALPDRAIGPLIADKLGQRVVDVLVDPLVGGIHAGRVRDLSAAAVYPPVLVAGQARGSLMRALQSASKDTPAVDGPAFLTLRDGMWSLPGLLEAALARRGVTCVPDSAVSSLRRGTPGEERWVVESASGAHHADAVVVATPPAPTASLLAPLDADAASMVASIDTASVAVVTVRVAQSAVDLPETGTGILIPAGTRSGAATFLASAVTFLDRKWPHLAVSAETLLRVSVGKIDDRRFEELDDDALAATVCDELATLVGLSGAPASTVVTRWPSSFPQYRVNHLVRVEGIEAAVGALGGVVVAGAAYRGVGIPACIASGRGAARAAKAWLEDQS